MTHEHDCPHGHNHDPNPYVEGADEAATSDFLINVFKLGTLTVDTDPHLTGTYVALACSRMVAGESPAVGCQAITWELARMINVMSSGNEPQFRLANADPDDKEQSFQIAQMEAFMSSAACGELPTALRVLDSVRLEAESNDEDPIRYMLIFVTNVLVSVMMTTQRQITDSRHLFNNDDD